MIETHEDYLTGEIVEVEVPDTPELEPDEPIVVDRAEYAGDRVTGYLGGKVVAQMSGIADISAVELFDVNGSIVVPAPAPPDNITKLQLAMAEMIEMDTQLTAGNTHVSPVATGSHFEPRNAAWELTPTHAIMDLYATLISKGLRTLEQIPERFRCDVDSNG